MIIAGNFSTVEKILYGEDDYHDWFQGLTRIEQHRVVHVQKHDFNRARIGIGMNAIFTIIVGTCKNCFNEYPQST